MTSGGSRKATWIALALTLAEGDVSQLVVDALDGDEASSLRGLARREPEGVGVDHAAYLHGGETWQ
jgi:hypothetical protein